jgi:hypothetical protein
MYFCVLCSGCSPKRWFIFLVSGIDQSRELELVGRREFGPLLTSSRVGCMYGNIKFKRCNKERKAVECTRDKSLHLVASSHNGLFFPASLWELVKKGKDYRKGI